MGKRSDDHRSRRAGEPSGAAAPSRPLRHRLRGGLMLGAGAAVALLLMSNAEHFILGGLYLGPLCGIVAMLVATAGTLDLLGLFTETPQDDAVPWWHTALGRLEGEPAWAEPRYTGVVSACILAAGAILGGYAALPWVILAALAVLVPPALRRPGLLVFVIVGAVYLPLLGTYGLWDPWETHYAEVAREILARDDWISLWWAQENWFWSKPILIFWVEALSMAVLGVDFRPDANPAHPEWAIRLPVMLMSLGAVLAVYAAVSRIFTRRAGVVAALVLATMPHFFFLAHQAITDIPFVGNMTIAVALLALALREDPDREVQRYRFGRVAVSARHLVLGTLLLSGLPQGLYLISRNVTMVEPLMFAWHGDQFLFGSGGNHGVPGNAGLRQIEPHLDAVWAQPAVQGVVWLLGLFALIALVWRERRAQSLYMFAFYYFCALAFMGKGIPGFGLPGLVSLLYLVASRRWNLLFTGKLRIAAGALIIAVIGLPWYVAMYVRHGPPFTDRLLVHDHLNRLAAGVHGDTGSIQYFITQLGYAMFPWVALAPGGLLAWLWYRSRRLDEPVAVPQPSVGAARATADPAWASSEDPATAETHRTETLTLFAIWFFAAFALFSAMITKFHHYIFPAVPPAAVLVGVLVDRLLGPREEGRGWLVRIAPPVLAGVAPLLLVLGVAGLYGDVRGVLPQGADGDWVLAHPWNPWLCRGLIAAGALLIAAAGWLLHVRASGTERVPTATETKLRWAVAVGAPIGGVIGGVPVLVGACVLLLALLYRFGMRTREDGDAWFDSPALGAAVVGGTVLVSFVGRDLSWETASRPQGYERLIHLFVYNYGRPWPAHFDYRPILTGFAIVAGVLFGMAVVRALRPVATRALLGLGLCFAAWAVNVYVVDLSPHWGQRGLVKTYYELREGPEEPLVAWQMNWKGENFYTGNRVFAFVDLDNKEIREWMRENEGRTAYFVFQHRRLSRFQRLMGQREVEKITTKRDCNKFLLARVTI